MSSVSFASLRLFLLAAVGLSSACSVLSQQKASDPCPANPYSLATSLAPPQMPSPSRSPNGSPSLVGVVVDSTSGRGIANASVGFIGGTSSRRDTVFARTDSTGAFDVPIPPGSYEVRAGSPNFHLFVKNLDVSTPLETLHISLQRGLVLCSIQVTGTRLTAGHASRSPSAK